MKGVVLAGGLGTRLYPLTFATNKHLLPVYDQPMVFYPINTLIKAGITEIIIVVGGPHAGDFLSVLKNGQELGITHLEYAYQEKEGGIAQALSLCENFADGDSVAVMLGDNSTDYKLAEAVNEFESGALIFLKEVKDPSRFGIAIFDERDKSKIIKIEEKPKNPKSKLAVTGLYLYDNRVFNFIKTCKPSWRNELEITDVNNIYIEKGQMKWRILDGFWSDAGTFQSLYITNEYWAKKKGLK